MKVEIKCTKEEINYFVRIGLGLSKEDVLKIIIRNSKKAEIMPEEGEVLANE